MTARTPLTLSRRRLLATGGAIATTLPLVGCSWLTLPEADAALQAQRALALRDIPLLPPELAGVRERHAAALAAEVTRTCGTRDDGTTPAECSAAPDPAPAPPDDAPQSLLGEARGAQVLYDALGDGECLRDDYEVLLAAAVDGGLVLALRALEVGWDDLVPAQPTPAELGKDDAEAIAAAMKAEYALIYGMGVAAPRVAGITATSVRTSADRHRLLRDRGIAALDAGGAEIPPADAGYDLASGAPDPDSDGAAFAADLEARAAQAWRAVVTGAKSPDVRMFALRAAGLAQAGASLFRDAPTAALPGLDDASQALQQTGGGIPAQMPPRTG